MKGRLLCVPFLPDANVSVAEFGQFAISIGKRGIVAKGQGFTLKARKLLVTALVGPENLPKRRRFRFDHSLIARVVTSQNPAIMTWKPFKRGARLEQVLATFARPIAACWSFKRPLKAVLAWQWPVLKIS